MLSRTMSRHVVRPLLSGAVPIRTFSSKNKEEGLASAVVSKTSNMSSTELYHASSIALAAAAPIAIVLSPSMLNMPVDLALGLIVPLHAHYGMKGVIEDYVPPVGRGAALLGLFALTGATCIGLAQVNLCGPGITESVKSFWREDPNKKKQQE